MISLFLFLSCAENLKLEADNPTQETNLHQQTSGSGRGPRQIQPRGLRWLLSAKSGDCELTSCWELTRVRCRRRWGICEGQDVPAGIGLGRSLGKRYSLSVDVRVPRLVQHHDRDEVCRCPVHQNFHAFQVENCWVLGRDGLEATEVLTL